MASTTEEEEEEEEEEEDCFCDVGEEDAMVKRWVAPGTPRATAAGSHPTPCSSGMRLSVGAVPAMAS
jgi:hypothetical protein